MPRRGPTKPHPGAAPRDPRARRGKAAKPGAPAPPPAPRGPIWARGPRLPNPLALSERIGVVLLFLGGLPAFASIPDGYLWLGEHPVAPAVLAVLPLAGIALLERRRLPRTVRMLSRGLVFGLLAPALVGVLLLTALPLVSLVAGIRAYFGGAGWVTPAALVTAGVTLVVASGGDREYIEGIAPLQSAPTVAYITVVAFTWAAAGILLTFRPPPGYDTT